MKSQTMFNHKIVPGVLTWPTTSQVIEETRTENLQVCLKKKTKAKQNKKVVILLPASPLSRPEKDGGKRDVSTWSSQCKRCCSLSRVLSAPRPGLCRVEFLPRQISTPGKHPIYSTRVGALCQAVCLGISL